MFAGIKIQQAGFKKLNEPVKRFFPLMYALTVMLIIISHTSIILCDPIKDLEEALDPFVQNGIDLLAYVVQLGEHWLWVLGLAAFILSFIVPGTKKDAIRKMAAAMFIAWIFCVFVNNDTSALKNTFDNFRDSLFGNQTNRDNTKFQQNQLK